MRKWVSVVVTVASCYSSNYATNVPCSADLTCPGSEVCDTSKAPPVCVNQLGSGTGSDIDASTQVTADAPMPVVCGNAICTNPAPVCDMDSTTCRPCYSDSDCPSHVCSESTGECADPANTLYVKNGGNDANTCTHDMPCANVSRAISLVDATRYVIKIYDGNYVDSFASSASYVLSGEGNNGSDATIHFKNSGGHAHLLEVDGGATVIVEGVSLDGGMQETVRVQAGSTFTLFNSEIENSPIGGIDSAMSNIHIIFSLIHDNSGGEAGVNVVGGSLSMQRAAQYTQSGACVHVQSAKYDIENTFLLGCTTVAFDQAGIVQNPAVFNFNTVANSGAGVTCVNAIAVRNSIFSNNGATQLAGCASATYSLFTDTPPGGTGNIQGDPAYVAGDDFHITGNSAAIDKGDPASTTNIDFDGDHRPHGAGFDIGADEH